jgi:protein-disulfide isomerase
VRFEYKNFAFLGETSTLAAEAVLCAADQGQFWPYHDTVFANQDIIFEPGTDYHRALKQMAKMLELDTRAFNRCFNGRTHRQDVQQELADGRARGVESTPTVFVNDVNLGYPGTFEEIQRVIEEELAKASQ